MSLVTFNPWHLVILSVALANLTLVVIGIVRTVRATQIVPLSKARWLISLVLLPGAAIAWFAVRPDKAS